MVTIRLSRAGAKKHPFYRIVVTDARYARDGRFLENIGTFDPGKEGMLVVKRERLDYWTGKGARPSATVTRILKKAAQAAKA